ncbi:helix-turn-helix domain-containing protein [Paenibacillus tritici]|uniref:helix-turn-helix transcriptional regulator n=1 Tax=Paenibacillus tritici TaxID=1873425 RepID=UPI001BA8ABDB|nr:helix-turn-helix domain-containing protein [Paenibacillus tritici]QUL57059.1 helix-turn-helix domain-containing protein [Paenibacillus tritici]
MNSHPGQYVRKSIVYLGISEIEAAQRVGIDESSLSEFLNGKSPLSIDLALRLEKSLGVSSDYLLEIQALYDKRNDTCTNDVNLISPVVPSFLTIKARQIENWAEQYIEARSLLPVLLRKLVHSTGKGLTKVDFPGYDNSQRKGSDGFIQSNIATAWIPKGDSYWEFGTNKNPGLKAEKDYNARLSSIDSHIRKESTYIFVTPRNWPAKNEWEVEKNETGEWKNVRAFDADILEQWLEQSVPAQIWIAEQLSLTTNGCETLNQAWNRWSNVSHPHLTPTLFAPSITLYKSLFINWIKNESNKPFVITADSHLEALAFLACLFNDVELSNYKDLPTVFTSPDALKTLIASTATFIPIVYSDATERELIDVYHRLHCIVYRPRNVVDVIPDIKLDLLNHEHFKEALISMGIVDSDIDKLARESGRSPTILRRRLSQNAAVSRPDWARNDNWAKSLVPMVLIGAWQFKSTADQSILSSIANYSYENIEEEMARLLKQEDSPVWSVGKYRGVTSKLDAIFAIAYVMTTADLDRFFVAAESVLLEIDPALELPEEQRWAASIYNKTRVHSNVLRKGICETLVIFSVHGNNLFQSRLGLNVEHQVSTLIRKLLTPLTLEKLLSCNDDLPHYAEAAPEEFLNIMETNLINNDSIVLGLLKPVDSSMFGVSPSRTGLLWGIESLAWRPNNLWRVVAILAQLSKVKIEDNWANKPINSLRAIFRSWMPQTAASLDQRLKVLDIVIKRFPDIGWDVCIEQIRSGSRIGGYNYKPSWRGDASGAGYAVSRRESYTFNRRALDILIDWSSHNTETLGDLIKNLQGIPIEDQNKVWDQIDRWSKHANDSAKAVLRECIRQYAFTRQSRKRKLDVTIRDRARQSYDSLQPENPMIRHAWLFAEQWIQESSDEIEDQDYNFSEHEQKIDRLRHEAMKDIWSNYGFEGVKLLLEDTNAANVIGQYVTSFVPEGQAQSKFIQQLLSIKEDNQIKAELCLRGFLLAIKEDQRIELLQLTSAELCTNDHERLLLNSPFNWSTWRLLDGNEALHAVYWKNVFPSWGLYESEDCNEIIECLLNAQRPRAAFHTVQMNFNSVDTSLFKRLLYEIVTLKAEPPGQFTLRSYHISKALSSLNTRSEVTVNEMARLEFMFIEALCNEEHEFPNLERVIATSPILYVQALALCFKRKDEGDDPEEWTIENAEQQAMLQSAVYRLLERFKRIPGTNEEGEINVNALKSWLTEVRELCSVHGRTEIGDEYLGKLLSRAPAKEGMWPCKEVCEAMEEFSSPGIRTGFLMGIIGSRGFEWRDEGGKQERELAAKYHDLAERLYFEYPFVGRVIEDIAEFYEDEAILQDTEEDISKRIDK